MIDHTLNSKVCNKGLASIKEMAKPRLFRGAEDSCIANSAFYKPNLYTCIMEMEIRVR